MPWACRVVVGGFFYDVGAGAVDGAVSVAVGAVDGAIAVGSGVVRTATAAVEIVAGVVTLDADAIDKAVTSYAEDAIETVSDVGAGLVEAASEVIDAVSSGDVKGIAKAATQIAIPVGALRCVSKVRAAASGASKYGSTPAGRPFTKHYGTETGPARNIPGSVVDETIDKVPGKSVGEGKTMHYDPENNVTVITGDGGAIVSARKGPPRSGQQ